MGIPVGDANVIMNFLGSLGKVVEADEEILEEIPIDSSTKRILLEFFSDSSATLDIQADDFVDTASRNNTNMIVSQHMDMDTGSQINTNENIPQSLHFSQIDSNHFLDSNHFSEPDIGSQQMAERSTFNQNQYAPNRRFREQHHITQHLSGSYIPNPQRVFAPTPQMNAPRRLQQYQSQPSSQQMNPFNSQRRMMQQTITTATPMQPHYNRQSQMDTIYSHRDMTMQAPHAEWNNNYYTY